MSSQISPNRFGVQMSAAQDFDDDDDDFGNEDDVDEGDHDDDPRNQVTSRFTTQAKFMSKNDQPSQNPLLNVEAKAEIDRNEKAKKEMYDDMMDPEDEEEEQEQKQTTTGRTGADKGYNQEAGMRSTQKDAYESNDPETQRDFKTAYNKLVEKMLNERDDNLAYQVMLTNDVVQEVENRKQFNYEEFKERSEAYQQKKKQKEQLMVEQQKRKELEECTFSPKTNDPGLKRNLNQFLEEQQRYLEAKENKIKEKAEEEKMKLHTSSQYTPAVNEKSRKIVEKLGQNTSGTVYERLYDHKNNQIQKQLNSLNQKQEDSESISPTGRPGSKKGGRSSKINEEPQEMFRPSIQKKSQALIRDKKIDQHLYEDALKRKEKQQEKEKRTSVVKNKGTSQTSEKYYLNKFDREFEAAISAYAEDYNVLSYMKIKEILLGMGFMTDKPSLENQEKALLYDLWGILKGEENGGVSYKNFRTFLLALLGLLNSTTKDKNKTATPLNDTEQNKTSVQGEEQPKNYGEFEENGDFVIVSKEAKRIHRDFNLFYTNRLNFVYLQGLKKSKSEEYSFKPQINPNTHRIAEQYREKLIGDIEKHKSSGDSPAVGGKVDLVDILTFQKQKDKVLSREEREQREFEKCTFKPQIIEYKQDNIVRTDDKKGNETGMRHLDLYDLAKKGSKKEDKSKADYEYEKAEVECTFAPNTKKPQQKRAQREVKIVAKNIDETIERMRVARQERENKQKMLERGVPVSNAMKEQPDMQFTTGGNKFMKSSIKDKKPEVSMKKERTPTSNYKTPRKLFKEISGANDKNRKSLVQAAPKQGEKPKTRLSAGDLEDGDASERIRQDMEKNNELSQISAIGHGNENGEGSAGEKNDFSPRSKSDEKAEEKSEHDSFDNAEQEDKEGEDKQPMLFVDVNLGAGRSEKIVVNEGDDPEQLARKFATLHGLDEVMTMKLRDLLEMQISGVLAQIEEEENGSDND